MVRDISKRRTVGYNDGAYYAVFISEIAPIAESLGISPDAYCDTQDRVVKLLATSHRGLGDGFNLEWEVRKIIEIITNDIYEKEL